MNSNRFHIKLADPNLDEAEMMAVRTVLQSGRLVKGPRCIELEASLRAITGRRHAVAVSSGSMALLAAMAALGVGPGWTVAVPAFTFPAPASVASFLGAGVVAVDVDPKTFNISQKTLLAAEAGRFDLVVAIDQFGVPAPVRAIEDVLASEGTPVLVDAACSIGSRVGNASAGSVGRAATFSFHPRKVVTTGEGGALLTEDDELARAAKRWVDQGVESGAFASIGLNLRLGEINCAIGLEQLKRLEGLVRRRRELARRYRVLPLRFQETEPGDESNYQTLAAVLPKGCNASDRDDLIAHLRDRGIESTIASFCLGEVPGIRAALKLDPAVTPVARELHDLGIALPLHPGLEESEVDEVVEVVHNWLNRRGWA